MDESIDDRISRIKHKVRRRGVRLETPADVAEVIEFERATGVELPEGYRRFLIEVGDGGEGPPLYGLKRLCDHPSQGLFSWKDLTDNLAKPFPFHEFWTWEERELDAERCAQTCHGNLRLGTDGCDMHWILIVTGRDRGVVWDWFDFAVQPSVDRRDFLTWYEDWLNGRDDRSNPPKQPMTDAEFERRYPEGITRNGSEPNTPGHAWWKFW